VKLRFLCIMCGGLLIMIHLRKWLYSRVPTGELRAIRLSNRVHAFLHTYFALLETSFPRITKLRIARLDHSASELVVEYLSRVDCCQMEELLLVLSLKMDADVSDKRPCIFWSKFPSLRLLYSSNSFLPTSLRFTGGATASHQHGTRSANFVGRDARDVVGVS
jgi:hypothetical protein